LEYLRQRWLFDMNPFIVMVIGTIYFPIYVTIMFFFKELSIRPVVTMFKRKWR
jgi:hypothetical protein